MAKQPLFALFSLGALAACTEPQPKMNVDEAMTVCRAKVNAPVTTNAGIGLTLGSGGRVKPSASLSVGIDLTAATAPQKAYENCVRRNSGQEPTQALNSGDSDE